MRALLYHLGVLKWLAERGFWKQVTEISSVSGGSWCVGCVLGHANGAWPTADQYLNETLPAIKRSLCEKSMLRQLVAEGFMSPWNLLFRRFSLFLRVFRKHWNLTGKIAQLPVTPVFHINATTLETGKRWVFTRKRMGDYMFGYSEAPDLPIAMGVAASSGFPFLIGSVRLDSRRFRWIDGPYSKGKSPEIRRRYPVAHLWDGGVYENTGLETFFKNGKLRGGIDFLIVADAAEPFEAQRASWWFSSALRLLFIAMEQVRSVRARQVVQMFAAEQNGFYAKIGTWTWGHLQQLAPHLRPWFAGSFSSYRCECFSRYAMYPHRVGPSNFDDMVAHAWQTCEIIYGAIYERGARPRTRYVADPVGVATQD